MTAVVLSKNSFSSVDDQIASYHQIEVARTMADLTALTTQTALEAINSADWKLIGGGFEPNLQLFSTALTLTTQLQADITNTSYFEKIDRELR